MRSYTKQGGCDLTFLLDKDGVVFVNQYKGTGFPTTFFVDTKGFIRAIRIGGMTRETLENQLNLIKNW